MISIHSPHTGRDWIQDPPSRTRQISIHSPHTGRDGDRCHGVHHEQDFNPLSPHGERQERDAFFAREDVFQSTLPTRGETYSFRYCPMCSAFQSTLPTRGETIGGYGELYVLAISIHSPHTGRDDVEAAFGSLSEIFQSTLPTRGETVPKAAHSRPILNFNPLSPHGERHHGLTVVAGRAAISIHSPHTGRDRW